MRYWIFFHLVLLTGTIQLSFYRVLEGVGMASCLRDEGMDATPRPVFSGMGTKVESCRVEGSSRWWRVWCPSVGSAGGSTRCTMALTGRLREGRCSSPLGDGLGTCFWEQAHLLTSLLPVTPVNISCTSALRAGCVCPGKGRSPQPELNPVLQENKRWHLPVPARLWSR